jgi:aminoglycoside phosphotransferase family enzyme/predicted kinase
MELPQLIAALSDPTAYPDPVGTVEVRQTHISVVFLAGAFVYKIKKPVAPGFLDFTTLARRLHFCREEVRLNRRLAPDVYLGVVPVARTRSGVRIEGDGEPIEWAVKMQRLPDAATLLQRVRSGAVDEALITGVANRIAAFHRGAETSDRIASLGRFAVVQRNFQDVFDRSAPQAGAVVTGAVFDRVRAGAESMLTQLRALIDARAARGVPRDGHGDLHLDHIYYFPERTPPGDLVIIDCIEFNEQFRFADPVADMAFVVMDLAFRGRRDLARTASTAYFRAAADEEGRALLPLYTAYRAAVRGMVDGLLLAEPEVPEANRAAAARRARAHWLLALTELEAPDGRPGLVLVGGLPGTGKSTLARALTGRAGFTLIRSDVVRKELAGLSVQDPSPPEVRTTLYGSEWNERTYAECLHRAEQLLSAGQRVLVDATFRADHHRRAFIEAAIRNGVPVVVLVCEAKPETVRERLLARRGDASDADWTIYQRATESWEQAGAEVQRVLHTVSTDATAEEALNRGLAILREAGLVG